VKREYVTSIVIDELLKQKEAHDELVDALKLRLQDLNIEAQESQQEACVMSLFLEKNHPELVSELVRYAYEHHPEAAKGVAEWFQEG
jgi:hypothetical protein